MWQSDVFQCTMNSTSDYDKREALIKELENHRFKILVRMKDSFTCFNWKFEKFATDDQLALIKNNGRVNDYRVFEPRSPPRSPVYTSGRLDEDSGQPDMDGSSVSDWEEIQSPTDSSWRKNFYRSRSPSPTRPWF